jgi:hypothetical protein
MSTHAHLLFMTRLKQAMFLKTAVSPTYGATHIYSLNCVSHKALVHVPHVVHSMHARVAAWLQNSLLGFP